LTPSRPPSPFGETADICLLSSATAPFAKLV
jgi:hypothetical protein